MMRSTGTFAFDAFGELLNFDVEANGQVTGYHTPNLLHEDRSAAVMGAVVRPDLACGRPRRCDRPRRGLSPQSPSGWDNRHPGRLSQPSLIGGKRSWTPAQSSSSRQCSRFTRDRFGEKMTHDANETRTLARESRPCVMSRRHPTRGLRF